MTLRENLRALPAAAWILFGGTFINRFGSFVMPFLVLYLTRRGYSIAQAGIGVGAYGAGHVFASMLGGHLADRIGRRHTIVLSMFASAIAMLALSQARSYPAILILTCFAGTAAEMYRPASQALLVDLVGKDQSVFAFGMYRFAVNLAFAAGPATAGFLADRSFLYLFVGDAITSVLYGLIALVFLPHGLRSDMKNERLGEAMRLAVKNKPFVFLLLATFLMTVVDFQLGSTFALHVQAAGFPSRVYGMLTSENGLLIICFELLITTYVMRFRAQPVIALGFLFTGIGFALTGFAHTIPALAGTVVIWTIGEMLSSPMVVAYVAQIAPEQYRGRYMGLLTVTWSFGMVVGPPLGTLLFAHNELLLWLACGFLGLTAAVIVVTLSRQRTV
ncbi:MAG TPA: MFS transporter [Thermoanaerobaculia bacterium]